MISRGVVRAAWQVRAGVSPCSELARIRSSHSTTAVHIRAAGPLSQGIVHGASVTCPLHNWVISLETGKALGADEGEVRTIPIKVEGDEIFIALDAATDQAA